MHFIITYLYSTYSSKRNLKQIFNNNVIMLRDNSNVIMLGDILLNRHTFNPLMCKLVYNAYFRFQSKYT